MKSKTYIFNNTHLRNIKSIFEEKTGTQLNKPITVFSYRKLAAALLAIAVCFSIGVPVLAANVPAIYRLMYLVSPGIAQFFMPVQKSAEYNGIKMEVVSAYIHGDTAEIYVSMQDLTSDRVDGTTDLYDSYSINRPFDCSAFCQLMGYDDETKTATFLISITEWGNRDITGEKITFSVREFLSHKNHYKDIEIPIDLSTLKIMNHTQQVHSNGGGGFGYPFESDEAFMALIPSEPIQKFPVNGINLTGIGYIDGQLHIQTAVSDPLSNDNHGFFYLRDINGNEVEHIYSFYFSNRYDKPEQRIGYCEYVFDISKEEIKQYSLFGNFVTSGMKTDGYWCVTFPLEQAE